VIDPFSALEKTDHPFSNIVCEILIDDVRAAGITLYMTSLIEKITYSDELTVSNVSTIADTWIHLTYRVRGGERNRALTVVKSRGTNHSNQVRELIITPSGLDLVDPYTAEGEVLMGSARAEKEERDARKLLEEQQDLRRRELAMKRQAAVLETQLEAMLEERRWRDQELEALRLESAERQAALQHASVTRRARREGSDPPAHNGKGR
jgi:circadian clock protein KaiC